MITIKKCVFSSPCLYRMMLGTECLYVGMSMVGFARAFNNQGSGGGDSRRKEAYNLCDRIQVIAQYPDSNLLALERKMIHENHPRFNSCVQCDIYKDGRSRRSLATRWRTSSHPTHSNGLRKY